MKELTLPPVKRGDTWNFKFSWKSQNIPTNLTNCTARMQVRDKRTSNMVAEVSSINNKIIIDGLLGEVTVTFSAIDTASILPGTYLSDLEITFTDTGTVKSSDTLYIVVLEDITR